MEVRDVYKQLLDFNKRVFDNSFSAMLLWQDQTENMFNTFMDQASWIPEDSRKAFGNWVKTYKRSLEDFHQAVVEGFNKVEETYHDEFRSREESAEGGAERPKSAKHKQG